MVGDGVEGAVTGIVEWGGDVVGDVVGDVFGAFDMLGEGVYVPVYGGVCAVGGLLLLFGEFGFCGFIGFVGLTLPHGTGFAFSFLGFGFCLEPEEGRCPFRAVPGLRGTEEGGC